LPIVPVPQHLRAIEPAPRTFGVVRYSEKERQYQVEAEPMVMELCKRLFPHVRQRGVITFPATQRAVEDLHWLMLRYPLRVEEPQRYAADLGRAIELANRRSGLTIAGPANPPAEFTGKLWNFQADDVGRMVATERMLLANDMGLGKTVEALAAIATARAFPALLVVQPHLQAQWMAMVQAFLHLRVPGLLPGLDASPEAICCRLRGKKPYALPEAPLYLIHYGLLDDWTEALRALPLEAIVFDEVQELRRTESKKYAAALVLSQGVRYAWGLSGTPIYNHGAEIWAVLNAIDYHCLGDRDIFCSNWCLGWRTEVVENPQALGDYLRHESLMIRRRKTDVEVASQLPPKRQAVVEIDQDDDVYRKLIGEAVRLASGWESFGWHDRGEAAREIETVARQAAGVAKAPFVAEFVRSLVEGGERPVVFAHHHAVHEVITEELKGKGVARMTGMETTKEKEEAKERFLTGKDQICLLALRASTGIDGLQKVGTCVVFAELDWSPAVHRQCEDRLHRVGLEGLDSLLAYYLVARNSFDETVRSVLGLKVAQVTGLMGDAPVTEEDRALASAASQEHLRHLIEALRGHPQRGEVEG
jgi:SNF2 family DNA or RNA helicase